MKTVESAAIENYAITFARSLLLTKEGKASGYWQKPFIGRPRVSGSAFVIGTYACFILGSPLAGLRREQTSALPILPGAESLVAYFLEYPKTKAIMDAHWKSSNDFAAKPLDPELRDLIGDVQSLFSKTDGTGRADEKILTIYWEIMRQAPASTIEQGMEALVNFFLYGTYVAPSEVKRLWGIQAHASIVPLMERPLEDAQAETVAEISSLLEPRTPHRNRSGPDKAAALELIMHLQTMFAYQQLTMERSNDAFALAAGTGLPAYEGIVRPEILFRDPQAVVQYVLPALQAKLETLDLMDERHTAFPRAASGPTAVVYDDFTSLLAVMRQRAEVQYEGDKAWSEDPSREIDTTRLDSDENSALTRCLTSLNDLIEKAGMRINEEPWLGINCGAFNSVRASVGLPTMSNSDFRRRYFEGLTGQPCRFFRD